MITIKNKIANDETIKLSRFKSYIKRTKPHKHEGYYELIFLEEGEGIHWIDDQKYRIEVPMVFVLKPGQMHCWELTGIPAGYVLMVQEAYLDSPNQPYIKPLLLKASTTTTYPLQHVSWPVFEMLDAMKVQLAKPGNYHQDIVMGGLQAILGGILQAGVQEGNVYKSAVQQTFEQFSKLLYAHIPSLNQVKQYSALLNTTPQNLNSICRKESGLTASEIIQREWLLEAKRHLLHTDNTIAGIADILCFQDSSYFIKFFKRHTGLTPFKFRQQYFQ